MAAISYPSPIASPRTGAPRPERHLRLIQGGRAAAPTAPGVYSRRRLVALALVAALAILAVVAADAVAARVLVRTAPPAATVAPVAAAAGAEVHVVQPGETLWSIAGGLTTDGDVRATVDRLVEANGGSSTIQVGQRLVLD